MDGIDACLDFLKQYTEALSLALFDQLVEDGEGQMPLNFESLQEIIGQMTSKLLPTIQAEGVGNYVFHICYRKFKSYPSFVKHKKSHTGKQLEQCSMCIKSFKSKKALTDHYLVIHSFLDPKGQTGFFCELCSKEFKRESGLLKHNTNFHPEEKLDNEDEENEDEDVDMVTKYSTSAMFAGLLVLAFNKSRQAGDGERILRLYKYMLLFFDISGKTKYKLYTLHTIAQCNVLLPPYLAFDVIHNRFTNKKGKVDTNKEIDMEIEHADRHFKKDVRLYNSKVTPDSFNRSATSYDATQKVLQEFDQHTSLRKPSGKHS